MAASFEFKNIMNADYSHMYVCDDEQVWQYVTPEELQPALAIYNQIANEFDTTRDTFKMLGLQLTPGDNGGPAQVGLNPGQGILGGMLSPQQHTQAAQQHRQMQTQIGQQVTAGVFGMVGRIIVRVWSTIGCVAGTILLIVGISIDEIALLIVGILLLLAGIGGHAYACGACGRSVADGGAPDGAANMQMGANGGMVQGGGGGILGGGLFGGNIAERTQNIAAIAQKGEMGKRRMREAIVQLNQSYHRQGLSWRIQQIVIPRRWAPTPSDRNHYDPERVEDHLMLDIEDTSRLFRGPAAGAGRAPGVSYAQQAAAAGMTMTPQQQAFMMQQQQMMMQQQQQQMMMMQQQQQQQQAGPGGATVQMNPLNAAMYTGVPAPAAPAPAAAPQEHYPIL